MAPFSGYWGAGTQAEVAHDVLQVSGAPGVVWPAVLPLLRTPDAWPMPSVPGLVRLLWFSGPLMAHLSLNRRPQVPVQCFEGAVLVDFPARSCVCAIAEPWGPRDSSAGCSSASCSWVHRTLSLPSQNLGPRQVAVGGELKNQRGRRKHTSVLQPAHSLSQPPPLLPCSVRTLPFLCPLVHPCRHGARAEEPATGIQTEGEERPGWVSTGERLAGCPSLGSVALGGTR